MPPQGQYLNRRGNRYFPRSDSETILHGVFGFNLWDEESKSLFASRDLFGNKSQYSYFNGG